MQYTIQVCCPATDIYYLQRFTSIQYLAHLLFFRLELAQLVEWFEKTLMKIIDFQWAELPHFK